MWPYTLLIIISISNKCAAMSSKKENKFY
jgi:hypothetical protein